jgi:AraC-like DNA-binding protein
MFHSVILNGSAVPVYDNASKKWYNSAIMKRRRTQHEFLKCVADVRRLLDVLERIPGAMFMIKDLDSRYIYMSRALKEAVNIPENVDVVGKSDFDLFPKIIAQNFRENDLQVFTKDKPLLNEIHAAGFFNHPAKWAVSTKYPLHDCRGRVIGLITVNEAYDKLMGQDAERNRLLPAIDHVTRHYADAVTVRDLARRCGYSETHFMRVFKKHMKMTAYAFVEQVRMFHAVDAVRHSRTPIARIAVNCGFYDHSAFVKRFKKFTGIAPLRYRRQYQQRLDTKRGLAVPKMK